MQEINLVMDGKSVVVQCSPNTRSNIERDQSFAMEVFNSTLNQLKENVAPTTSRSDFDDILQQSTSAQAQGANIDLENFVDERDRQNKAVWLDGDCKLLISIYKRYIPDLGKKAALKTKRKLWECIAQELNEGGTNFTPIQVEGKWKSLERAFKAKVQHNKKTGNNRMTCRYERELSEILLQRPAIVPDYVLGSTLDSGMSRSAFIQTIGMDVENENNAEVAQHEQDPELVPQEELELAEPIADENNQNDANATLQLSPEEPPQKKRKRATTVAYELSKWREQFKEESRHRKEYRKQKLDSYNKRTLEMEKSRELKEKYLEHIMKNNTSE